MDSIKNSLKFILIDLKFICIIIFYLKQSLVSLI